MSSERFLFKTLLFLLFLASYALSAVGQVKYEKEIRIDMNQVPEKALNFIKNSGINSKVKWYKELNIDNTSIEAKTTFQNTKYSIEFDTLGNLQDVEYIINFKELPDKAQAKIEHQFDSLFTRYKIIKTQTQFSGPPQIIQQLLKGKKPSDDYITRYEIVMGGKEKKIMRKFEILTNENGEILQRSRIIPQNMDNLIY